LVAGELLGLFDGGQAKETVLMFMKSLGFALGMLSLVWIGGLATADEVAQGKALFMHYCASCHGPNGAGDGPLASSLSTPPANLRLLSLRFGNPLPQDVIGRFIDGRADVKAHGPRDMPVWGEKFYAESNGEESKVEERIAKLVAFLQSIQTGARTASLNLEWAASRERETKPPAGGNPGFLSLTQGES
jgi:mono/diheme cytochrome c family protein